MGVEASIDFQIVEARSAYRSGYQHRHPFRQPVHEVNLRVTCVCRGSTNAHCAHRENQTVQRPAIALEVNISNVEIPAMEYCRSKSVPPEPGHQFLSFLSRDKPRH
jgi:hypothetical protein